MRKQMGILLLLAAALFSFAGVSNAALKFDSSPNSQARRVVNVLFSDYLQARTGIEVQTALTDLENDKVGEIVVRFVHSSSCLPGMQVCRTVVVKHDEIKGWRVVLDRNAKEIEILQGTPRVAAPIRTDKITWSWAFPSYKPDFDSLGKTIEMSPMPDETIAQVAPAFGQGAVKLHDAQQQLDYQYSEVSLGENKKAIVVAMKGELACGIKTGCPVRVLLNTGKTWAPVMQASAQGPISLGNTAHGGFRDIVVSTDKGAVVMGWTGKNYAVADRIEQTLTEDSK